MAVYGNYLSEVKIDKIIRFYGNKAYNKWLYTDDGLRYTNRINSPKSLVRFIEYYDPSPKKCFTRWMVRLYSNDGIEKLEDITSKLAYDLKHYHRLSKNGRITGDDKNIDKFKSMCDFLSFMNNFENESSIFETLSKNEQWAIDNGQVKLLMNNLSFAVVIPKTFKASKIFGTGTYWYTKRYKEIFNEYINKGELVYIKDKVNHKKYAIHFEKLEFVDENNIKLTRWFNDYIQLYKYLIEYKGGIEYLMIKTKYKLPMPDYLRTEYAFYNNIANKTEHIFENEYVLVLKPKNSLVSSILCDIDNSNMDRIPYFIYDKSMDFHFVYDNVDNKYNFPMWMNKHKEAIEHIVEYEGGIYKLANELLCRALDININSKIIKNELRGISSCIFDNERVYVSSIEAPSNLLINVIKNDYGFYDLGLVDYETIYYVFDKIDNTIWFVDFEKGIYCNSHGYGFKTFLRKYKDVVRYIVFNLENTFEVLTYDIMENSDIDLDDDITNIMINNGCIDVTYEDNDYIAFKTNYNHRIVLSSLLSYSKTTGKLNWNPIRKMSNWNSSISFLCIKDKHNHTFYYFDLNRSDFMDQNGEQLNLKTYRSFKEIIITTVNHCGIHNFMSEEITKLLRFLAIKDLRVFFDDGYTYNGYLDLKFTFVKKLPKRMTIKGDLYVSENKYLKRLPDNLTVHGNLIISGSRMRYLPNNLKVYDKLVMIDCIIETFDDSLYVENKIVIDCYQDNFKYIPEHIREKISYDDDMTWLKYVTYKISREIHKDNIVKDTKLYKFRSKYFGIY